MLKNKIWASFQRIIELFTQKFVTTVSSKKYGVGIRIRNTVYNKGLILRALRSGG
jgi:hypothetical protein